MKEYVIGTLIGVNLMFIWLTGIQLTNNEARIRLLEDRQVGIEESQAHTLARMEMASKDMVRKVYEAHGWKVKSGH